jgi:hypothetical protein
MWASPKSKHGIWAYSIASNPYFCRILKKRHMKKNVLFLLGVSAFLSFQACTDDSCAFEGNWTVQSAEVQSAKLSPSIVQMTKEDYQASVYDFAEGGKVTVNGAAGSKPKEGSWSFDQTSQVLTMGSPAGAQEQWSEKFQMVSCVGGEMTLSQRIPEDTNIEAVAEVKLVIKKTK